MLSFNPLRWLNSWLISRRVKTYRKQRSFRLCLEGLEDRLAPAQFTWTGAHAFATGGGAHNWRDPANWQGALPPSVSPTPVELVFQNSLAQWSTANNDLTGLIVDQLTF